jgi:hypothetical protein
MPEGPSGKRVFVLHHGNYQARSNSGERMAPVAFQELILPITESAQGSPRVREWHGAFEQHIGVLLQPPPDIVQDSNLYGDYVSLGHLRIAAPLSCLGCAIFALGLMLAVRYERRSGPMLGTIGALTGVSLWQALLVAAYFAVYHAPSLAPLLYVVAVTPAAIGAPLLRSRTHGARQGIQRLSGVPAPVGTTET